MTLTSGVHPVSERRGGERWLTGGVRLSVSITHARGRGVISHEATDSDPRWSDLLACHASKSGNFVSNFSLCW